MSLALVGSEDCTPPFAGELRPVEPPPPAQSFPREKNEQNVLQTFGFAPRVLGRARGEC